jgi:TolB-like protein
VLAPVVIARIDTCGQLKYSLHGMHNWETENMSFSTQQRNFCILLIAACALLATAQAASARPARVIITEFDANSAEEMRQIQTGISALLPARIAVEKKITVIDSDAQSALRYRQIKSAPLRERCAFAKALGADYLIAGSITRLGEMISIDSKILDAQNCGEPVPVFIQCAGMNGLIPEINRLGQTIKKTIEENPAFDSYAPAQAPAAAPRRAPAAAMTTSGSPAADRQPAAVPEDVPVQKFSQPRPEPLPVYAAQRGMPGALFAAQPVLIDYIRSIPLQCLAAGDVNGDGTQELLAAGGNEIHVLRCDRGSLVRLDDLKSSTAGRIVHLDTADLNGHPPDEIYVSSFNSRSADSSVLEFKDTAFGTILSSLPWFFRKLAMPDGKPLMIGQDARLNNPFAGNMYSLDWDNGALKAGMPYKIPGGLNVYGFTPADIAGGSFLAFSGSMFAPEYSLKILNSDGKQLWRDTQSLGGTANFFKKTMFANENELQEPVPLRILYDGGQAGGKPFMLVARNVKRGQKIIKELINYNQGEVLCLVWNGADFDINWRSGYLNGYVADYVLADIDGDGRPELCILSSTGAADGGRAVNKISIYRRIVSEN